MTKEELAKTLDGREIGKEITDDEESQAKTTGLVVVFGASDDLMEFRGAIDDEASVYGGRRVLVDTQGLLPDRTQIHEDDDEILESFFIRKKIAAQIHANWCENPGCCWTYRTTIPHTTFEIVEKEEHKTTSYCYGIVFNLSDAHQ